VVITYGPNGVSRGIATLTFRNALHANQALKAVDGILVDGRPVKVEMVLDAKRAPPLPPAKSLSERVVQPKPQPKPATASSKASLNFDSNRARVGRGRGRGRARNTGRPKPKTADELDAEMADYWGPAGQSGADNAPSAIAINQSAIPNGEGDVGMDDEGDVL